VYPDDLPLPRPQIRSTITAFSAPGSSIEVLAHMFGDDLEEEPDEPAVIVQGRLSTPPFRTMTFGQVFTPNLKSPVALDGESDGVFMFGTTRGVHVGGTAGHRRDSAARVRTTVTLHDASATTCDETLPR
jgi:hypothetical protein